MKFHRHSFPCVPSFSVAALVAASVILIATPLDSHAQVARGGRTPSRRGTGGAQTGLYGGAGAVAHNAGRSATNAVSAEKPLFTEIYPQLVLAGIFRIWGNIQISPELRYAVTTRSSPEGGEKTRVFSAGLRGNYPIISRLDAHLGPGMMFYQISGAGGTITLSNGSGTSVFGIPNTSATTRALYWDAGFGVFLGDLRLEAGVLVTGILSSRRAFNPVASLTWRFL